MMLILLVLFGLLFGRLYTMVFHCRLYLYLQTFLFVNLKLLSTIHFLVRGVLHVHELNEDQLEPEVTKITKKKKRLDYNI